MSQTHPVHELDRIQRWMQAVIVHPEGVEAGMRSPMAREQIDVAPEEVEQVIRRSRRQTSLERLSIYANAYYARLLECLREEFPALAHAVGEEAFHGFAFGYLQAYPSQSYTLAELGRRFPQFLRETRPKEDASADGRADWTDFVIDLATVERAYSEVFDGPGIENGPLLRPEELAAIPPDRWPAARLVPAPCLRLLTLTYPVHEYISAVRKKARAVVPEPDRTFLVVTRRNYVVRRCAVSQDEFLLLSSLVDGVPIGLAIQRLAEAPDTDLDALAANLHAWFQSWAAAGYFQAVSWSDE